MRIKLGQRIGEIVKLWSFGTEVLWLNGNKTNTLDLDKFSFGVWVDDEPKEEPKEEPYRSPLTIVIFKQLAEAVERSKITIEPGRVIHLDDMLSASKLIAELKKLSEV